MAENTEPSGHQIKITVKTPKEKQEIELSDDDSIKTLKEKVAEKFKAPIEQLCLIFAGKILKETDTLSQHGIKDGLTVHLVIKSVNKSQEQAAQRSTTASPGTTPTTQPQPNIGATPFGLGGIGGLGGMGNLGMGSANFMEMQQRMQREMMGNPEMLRQMMDNPMVQQMMSNPDVMRQLITSNPQMRDLMERNPEITHMLNNPELMRQTLELARNPSMLQELMRSQDRAMSNLESIPGGFNALQRMYRDIQEPMMNAAQEGFGGSNPFSSLVNNQSGEGNADNTEQQGRENTNPLPNPWAPTSTSSSTTTSSTPTTGQMTGGMFNTPGMQSLMSQMSQNPQLIQNMMQAPYMQTMLQSMASNPELAQQVIESNPMFAGNPQLSENFRQYLPTMLQQMQNPEVQGMMTNPRAMEAIMQIQRGMQQLQSEAPGMFSSMNVPGMSMPPTSPSSTDSRGTGSTSSTTTTTAASSGDTSTSTTSSTSATPTPTSNNAEALNNMMAQMVQMMAGGTINQPPEQRYASQLDQLATMGFVDREANIRALQATLGDVNAAVDRLLQQR